MRALRFCLAAFLGIATFRPAAATPEPLGFGPPVSDETLADSYGKFLAPGGIELAMSVLSDTAVDGHLVLRSVFTVDKGPPSLQVYAPAVGTQGPAVQGSASNGATGAKQTSGVSVQVDRAGGITTVRPVYTAPAPTVSVNAGPASQSDAQIALVPVAPQDEPVATGAGTVTTTPLPGGARVTLDAGGLAISHLVGSAIGTVIANTTNDRTIDTVTTVQLDLHNAGAIITGSSLLRVDAVATAATRAMIR